MRTDDRDLDPSADRVIKREPRTWVWRESGGESGATVVKLYRKRGVFWWARSMVVRFRAEREFRRLAHLMRSGIPCTEPVAWTWGYSGQHGFHEILVTFEVPGAVDLGAFLREGGDPATLGALFATVRRMHEAGFCHQALSARNILVRPTVEGPHFLIADVPRSWTFPTSIAGRPMARGDVRDLVLSLVQHGVAPAAIPVDAYGLEALAGPWGSDGGRRRIVAEAARATSKRARLRRDLIVRLRWAAAWARGRRRA